MRFCVSPLRMGFYLGLSLRLLGASYAGLQSPDILGIHLPGAGPLGWGTQCEAQTPCSSGRASEIVTLIGRLPTWGVCDLIICSSPLLPIWPHSSTLAWKIPWMEEPGRLQSMGSQRVEHD